jgi:membrane-bound lytic murein transglycosylase D
MPLMLSSTLKNQSNTRPKVHTLIASYLVFFLSFIGFLSLLFVLFLNLPENSFFRLQIETGADWLQDSWAQIFDKSESPLSSQNEIVESLAESDSNNEVDPQILKDSTLWPRELDILSDHKPSEIGSQNSSPLINPNPFQRLDALKDPLDRVDAQFSIPDSLFKRTQFWFDVYTRYDSNVHIIHHMRYPWIVFKVIDTREMVAKGKGPLWLRRERAQKHVAQEKAQIIHILRRLSKINSFAHLSPSEQALFDAINELPGNRSSAFRFAAQNVRSQLGQMDFFVSGLRWSQRYIPYMEEIFSAQGLPADLTRLPFVESSFNVKAQSKVGASGIWQIMPRTGKAYLNVSSDIDERNSPLKATLAAARILRSYFHALKSWPLAVTGYNHGIGGVLKARRKVQSSDLATIIRKYHGGSFKFASSNFYTCFLAALYAEKYHNEIFPFAVKDDLLEREVIKIESPLRLKRLASLTGLDVDVIIELNLDLRNSSSSNPLLPRGFDLHLPPGFGSQLKRKVGQENSVPKTKANSVKVGQN